LARTLLKMNKPIKDTIKIITFLAIAPLYLFCDIFSGGLDR